jgi:hypothetical protein
LTVARNSVRDPGRTNSFSPVENSNSADIREHRTRFTLPPQNTVLQSLQANGVPRLINGSGECSGRCRPTRCRSSKGLTCVVSLRHASLRTSTNQPAQCGAPACARVRPALGDLQENRLEKFWTGTDSCIGAFSDRSRAGSFGSGISSTENAKAFISYLGIGAPGRPASVRRVRAFSDCT